MGWKMKDKCIKCGVKLELGKNIPQYRFTHGDYMCNDCNRIKHNKWNRKNKGRLKKYYKENRDKILEKAKRYHEKKREKHLKTFMRYYEKIRREVIEILGDRCVICGWKPTPKQRQRLNFHEIHGKRHPSHPIYILNDIQNFIPLCVRCHRTIHNYHRYKERIEELESKMEC